MHHHDTYGALFAVANLAIAAGYGSIPFLVLPFIRLTTPVLLFGAGFFLTCGGLHLGMVFGHSHVSASLFWTVEHIVQAICTWGFIVGFHLLLRRAHALRIKLKEPPGGPS